jgi:large subunit ribosomal protein L10e
MPSLRKAAAYSKANRRPYTRISKNRGKAYVKVNPHNKIVKYHGGEQNDYIAGKHKFAVSVVVQESVQIRDVSLEASRQLITKHMDNNALGQYYIAIKVFPHHLIRENKAAAGAGADRLSSGMSHSFGSVIGRSAKVKPGQTIFFVSCTTEKVAKIARDAMKKVKSKIPAKMKITFEEIDNEEK